MILKSASIAYNVQNRTILRYSTQQNIADLKEAAKRNHSPMPRL